MPILEMKKLRKMLSKIEPKMDQLKQKNEQKIEPITEPSSTIIVKPLNNKTKFKKSIYKTRSKSLPRLSLITLVEEYDIDLKQVHRIIHKTTDLFKFTYGLNVTIQNKVNDVNENKIDFYALGNESDATKVSFKIKKDLDDLLLSFYRKNSTMLEKDVDKPLVMNLMSKPNHIERLNEIKNKIKAIDSRYQKFKDETKIPINNGIDHLQPATVERNLSNSLPVRLITFKFILNK
jgi:hypothetical protein